MGHSRFGHRPTFRFLGTWLASALLIGTQLAVPVAQAAPISSAAAPATDPAAPTSTITLAVIAARTEPRAFGGAGVTKGDAVPAYTWMINEDNTGTTVTRNANPGSACSAWLDAAHTQPNPAYPGSCTWTSIAGLASSAPVVAQGDESDIASGLDLPDGRYLISVLADGYKLDGTHFTIPMEAPGVVTVPLQPLPLPTATIKSQVFADVTSANGQYDPGEDGLPGFSGKITDYIGQVNTDVFGNPLCTKYEFDDLNNNGVQEANETIILDAANEPTVTRLGGKCLTGDVNMDGLVNATDENLYVSLGLDPALARGVLTIPNLGPNRYALAMVPPTGSDWVQTTTLEGNHDWDAWVMEGSTGLDTEFVVAGEPFPATIFGYVPGPTSTYQAPAGQTYWDVPAHKFAAGGTGTIKGVVDAMKVYVPTTGGACLPGTIWGGLCGGKIDKPIDQPWITLSDLNRGDTAVWSGRGNANGEFTISNVPAGSYTLTYWDEAQNYILDLIQVTVDNGETVDTGVLPLTGWFTQFEGFIFDDANRNGVKDAGEPGVPNFGLTLRKRENSLMDRGATAVATDADGYYVMENAYPLTEWLVLEAYDDRYYTTGVTYQADNQPNPTTVLGQGVDISVLPIIGLGGRLDWGVHTYDADGTNGVDPQNGGIVGSISYDTTRNELDPQYAAAEDWQPGVSGITVELYATVPCGTNPGTPCDARGDYELATDGSYSRGKQLNSYVSETWERPKDCIARGVDGTPLDNPDDQLVLPVGPGTDCLEGPLMGVQFGPYPTDQGTPDANFGAAVDGNYGFGDACFDGTLDATDPANPICVGGTFSALPADDYLVHVDLASQVDVNGDPIYKVTREEDINIGNGDTFVPQVPPPACAGPLHTVDVAGMAPDGPNATVNPTFVDIGGSPYEGQARPLCDTKLVPLQNGKSVVPMFNVFTDVPLPGRFFAYNVDDLAFSADPKSLLYGEKAGLPFAPVGIYDFANRLVTTAETDYNGLFDVLLPSTNRINCPTPSGVCGNLYRFVGNDPGIPGRLNLNYNPQYRTIAAEFEAWPGIIVPADTAPTQVGVTVQLPGTQTLTAVSCPVNDPAATPATRTPELYALSRPYATGTQPAFTVFGQGFGATKGSGQLTLDGTPVTTASWSDTQIGVTAVLSPSMGLGPHQLKVTAANGKSTVNGLTFYRIGGSYNPQLYEVGPTSNPNFTAAKQSAGRWFAPAETLPATANHAIQNALDAAPAGALVVVYPNDPSVDPRQNPRGAYYENLIISKRVKLQGVGPGSPDGSVRGSIIDGGAFGGDSPVATDWYTRIDALTWAGNQTVYDGAVISLYLPSSGTNAFPTTYSATTAPSIDGFDLRGGDQQGFPGNINVIGGGPTGLPGGLITQGGAIFANAYARNLQITNNVIQNNGGAFGTIRIGTPDLPAPDTNNENDGVRIANNRIIANGGTNLAGGIGLFAGSDGYAVAGNDICGNFSAEYGGGLSVYGLSPGGSIDHNRVYYNQSYDEGGGIMIAGQLPADPAILSPGTGAVSIHENLVQANLGNDDGGGIRFLMAGNFPMNVYNNMIVNNVSTHEGGGIAIDDAPNVRVYNNTIMKNVTTATAVTSNGQPAPAGLSTGQNSALLQATLPGGSPLFSNPLLFNNIFWDNRAGTRSLDTVTGIGAADANHWDMGVPGTLFQLAPTNTILQSESANHNDVVASPTNRVDQDPLVGSAYDTSLTFAPWRTNPNFVGAILVAADLPPRVLGDYHLSGTASPAYNAGAASKTAPAYQQPPASLAAPSIDIDNQPRPALGGFDSGADEFPGALVANLSITKTDGVTSVVAGSAVEYTISVANAGPNGVTLAPVTDNVPTTITGVTWRCTAPVGSLCGADNGSGNIATTVNLPPGGSATFTLNGTVAANATGTLANTATVATASGTTDPTPGNNSATDTDTILPALPTLGLLDDFNRADAANLGVSWSQQGPFTQNFDTLANSGTSGVVPSGWAFLETGTNANAAYAAGTGSSSTGNTYSFGATASSERAFGGLRSGTLIPTIGATFANTTGSTISSLLISYTGEQWRLGGTGRTDRLDFQLSTNATSLSTGTWTDYDVLDFSGPVSSGTVGALDGNVSANRTAISATLTGLSIPNGASFWIRWTDWDVTGADDGLAIDDFSLTPIVIGVSGIGVSDNQAVAAGGQAIWNVPTAGFAAKQGTAFTLVQSAGSPVAPISGSALILKASGGTATTPSNSIRVRYTSTSVVVETTTNGGGSYTTRGTFTATLATGDTLTAVANADGSVDAWKTSGATTTYVGRSAAVAAFAGSGRIGIQLPSGARVDNFSGGTVP